MTDIIDDTTAAAGADFESIDGTPNGLFVGDAGDASYLLRCVFAQLKKGPMLTHADNPDMWDEMIGNLDAVRRDLSNNFLVLVLHRDSEVAYARQAELEDPHPKLMPRVQFKLLDSAVLVCLRRALVQNSGTGEPTRASLTDIQDEIIAFQQFRSGADTNIRRNIAAVFGRFDKLGLIKPVKDSDDRFVVSEMLRTLFPVEEVEALYDALVSMRGTEPGETETETDDEGEVADE